MTNQLINYLNEIMNDHWEDNKSIYQDKNGNDTSEWRKVDRMNHRLKSIVRYHYNKEEKKPEDITQKKWVKGHKKWKEENESTK